MDWNGTNTEKLVSIAASSYLGPQSRRQTAAPLTQTMKQLPRLFTLALTPSRNARIESQRDSGSKPRVARNELSWGIQPKPNNPNGVAAPLQKVLGVSLRVVVGLLFSATGLCAAETAFRPPAVPLVTSDPFLSIWCEADHLNDDVTRHWTHREHSLTSLIRVDGKSYRLMGKDPKEAPAFPQTAVVVLPTRSIYDFDNGQVHVTMTFMTPALPHDLDAFCLPLSYITWAVKSVDGKRHEVSIYDSASSQIAVNNPGEKVSWGRESAGGLIALRG